MTRSTSNANQRGNTTARRRRKLALLEAFRADVDVRATYGVLGATVVAVDVRPVPLGEGEPACRCYRCGDLLTLKTLTVDRRVPNVEGGTYDPANTRPCCAPCNSSTGGKIGARRRAERRVAS